jgi:hypothetical protein
MITYSASTKAGACKEAVAIAILSNPVMSDMVRSAAAIKHVAFEVELVAFATVIATLIVAADA